MELAARRRRLSAALIDGLIGAVPFTLTMMETLPLAVSYLGLGGLLALVAYQLYSMGARGQTIGKRLLSIRVVLKDTETNGGFAVNVLKRGLIPGLLSIIPGFFLVDSLFIFRGDRRCLHDFIAGTSVIVGQPQS